MSLTTTSSSFHFILRVTLQLPSSLSLSCYLPRLIDVVWFFEKCLRNWQSNPLVKFRNSSTHNGVLCVDREREREWARRKYFKLRSKSLCECVNIPWRASQMTRIYVSFKLLRHKCRAIERENEGKENEKCFQIFYSFEMNGKRRWEELLPISLTCNPLFVKKSIYFFAIWWNGNSTI